MNYQLHYDRLISRARIRILVGVRERHHVQPKCLGGSNESDNLVDLTPEEHYVAHQLLIKIHPQNYRLASAAQLMTVSKHGHRTTNKLYGWIRKACALPKSLDHRKKISVAKRGISLSPDHFAKTRRNGKKNKNPFSEVHKARLIAAHTGKPKSVETRMKISEGLKRAALNRSQAALHT